ncbi:MAG TPA: sugar ABC transporter substrate-binding protein [Actinokineospora sp.]|nr:sugar ABC transporter substrate-binding protein [Actinokineospora sp.]
MRIRMRATARLTAALAALSLAAACGGTSGGAAQNGPTEITFWSWTKGSAEVVDAFNAAHTDVKVKFEQIPAGPSGGYTKFSTALKAGNAPDVMNIEYPVLPDYVSQGNLVDLTQRVADVRDRFPEQIRSLYELGGKTWALPMDITPMAFYYRKDFFDANGIAVPTTWDEYRAAAAKVKQVDPKARIGTLFTDEPQFLAAFAWQAGGKWFDTSGGAWNVSLDDPATRKVADYWQGLVDDDLVNVPVGPAWNASVKAGETVGYVGASWGAQVVLRANQPEQAGKWAAAPVPHWGTPAGGMFGGSTFAVSANSKKVDASVKFIRWMTTDEKAVTTRIGVAKSTMYPAATDLVPAAAKSFDPAFFGGQNVYDVFAESAKTVKPGWTWGPGMLSTFSTLKDGLGQLTSGRKLSDSITAANRSTVDELRKRGLNVGS